AAPAGNAALATDLTEPYAVAVGPDGLVYFGDGTVIRRVAPVNPGLGAGFYVLSSDDGRQLYEFDAHGRHLRTLDALTSAVELTFSYDTAGRLVAVTDRAGRTTRIEHDGAGHPTAIVGPYGHRTTLAVDSDGWLSRITAPDGSERSFEYAQGLLVRNVDPLGHASSYEYDDAGRLIRAVDREGHAKTLSSTRSENTLEAVVETPLGRTTRYVVERGRDGSSTRTTTGPSGAAVVATLGADDVESVTRPDGTVITRVLKPDALLGRSSPVADLTLTTPSGLTVEISTQQSASNESDRASLTLEETLTIGTRALTSRYDAATRTFSVTSPAGRQVTRTIDDVGRPLTVQPPGLAAVSYAYDADGRIESITHGAGSDARTVGFTYGADGNVATITDPLGRSQHFAYDAFGRVISRTLVDGRVVGFEYDEAGRTIAVTPPGRSPYTFSWTPRGQLAAFAPPAIGGEEREIRFTYDADAALTRVQRPGGTGVEYVYDSAGRVERVILSSGAQHLYTYDPADRIESITVPDGTLSYTWDGPLLTDMTWTGAVAGSVTRSYDDGLRVASLAVNGDAIAYAYDDDGYLVAAGDLTLTRAADSGLVTGATLGGVVETFVHDAFGEIVSRSAAYNGAALHGMTFERNALGRITRRVETLEGAT